MIVYAIVFNKAVANQIKRLPGNIKALARQQIAALSENPRPSYSQELAGHPQYYRIWLGAKYRLVWYVDDAEYTVRIEYVGLKLSDLYIKLGLKRPTNGDDEQ